MNGTRNPSRFAKPPRKATWFASKKAAGDPTQKQIECLIGIDAQVAGDVIFSGGLRIDGQITGDVSVSSTDPGTLVLGEQGVIVGQVRVSHLIVFGRIVGTVHAAGLVELHPGAHIQGDLHYQALEMHAGAVIEGYLHKHESVGPLQ